MRIHTLLDDEVDAFNFERPDFDRFLSRVPVARLEVHAHLDSLLSKAAEVDVLLTWKFEAGHYARFESLQTVFTPAAGDDWVKPDPNGKVTLVHGRFHGPILAESCLHAILHMNHKLPAVLDNQAGHHWDRNVQRGSRLLHNQQVLVVGHGAIGKHCARLLQAVGAEVIGFRRNATSDNSKSIAELETYLPGADHVVMLLPGGETTRHFMSAGRLALMKPGAYLYNFGRGTTVDTAALLPELNRLGGAFLDVVETEPLPAESPLWDHPCVTITPHSSCVYDEYRTYFLDEVADYLLATTTQPS